MNFKFDLQMFAAFAAATPTEGQVTSNGTAWVAPTASTAAGTYIGYYSGGIFYLVTTATDNAGTIVGSVTPVTAIATDANNVVSTTAGNTITFGTGETLTLANSSGSVGLSAGTVTSLNNTGVVTLVSTAGRDFSGVSGSVSIGAKGILTLSNASANITDAGVITGFTTGTIDTAPTFSGTFMGTDATGANTLGFDSSNTIYTITAKDNGTHVYGGTNQIGKDYTSWSVTGGNGVGTFTTKDVTGKRSSVTLNGGGGDDIFTLDNTGLTYVDGGTGGDDIQLKSSLYGGSSIIGGAGNDTVDDTPAGGALTHGSSVWFDLGDGDDTFKSTKNSNLGNSTSILGGAGKDTINLAGFAAVGTDLYVDGGDGADEITDDAAVKNSQVLGGDGNDTISGFDTTVALTGGSGSDYFVLGANTETANITDYSFGEDYLQTGATASKTVAIAWAAGGSPKLKSNETAAIISDAAAGGYGSATLAGNGGDGFFKATLIDNNGDKANVAWVGDKGTTIDASNVTIASAITGRTNSEADLLVGGSKADTIYAGASDSVYGGAGSDDILVNGAGVYVGLSTAGGADTVTGFTNGWDIETADAVYMMDGDASNLTVANTGTNITLKSGSATMTLVGGGATTDANILINDKKVDVIAKGKTITVTDDSTIADYYIGTEGSGISLSKYTGDLEVNLSNDMFRNITTLEGGAGSTSILGGKAAESLKGGTGDSSLYGGAGVDTLVSGDGKTTFFATAESGKDVVTGFVVGSDDTSDVLNVSSISKVSRTSGTNFTVNVDNSNSLKVTQKSGNVNSNIQWVSGNADGVAKIGITGSNNNFSYDTDTTNYIGSNKVDTVSLTSGTTDNFNVWLDQTGGMFNSIEVYDLKNTSGDVLMAGKADTKETIIGGKSNTSLWGGAGNTTDVLKSTSGSTTNFFYGLGDGNDSISGSANDAVNLYNINLSDITKADINSGSVVFTTTANNTVTVSGSVGTFKLADGTAWTANYSSKTWSEAQ